VVVQRGSPLVSQLQLPQGVPALLVAVRGLVLGRAHITQFGGHDIWEEEVRRLVVLRCCAVLEVSRLLHMHSIPVSRCLGGGGYDAAAASCIADSPQVMAYLRRFKVLSTGEAQQQRSAGSGGGRAAAASDDDGGSTDEEGGQVRRCADCSGCAALAEGPAGL
jgi:hypothetical protein